MIWVVISWPVDAVVAASSIVGAEIFHILSHFLGKRYANKLKKGFGHIVSGIFVLTDQITVFDFCVPVSEVGYCL